jgi:hypothetical protein
VQLRDQSAQTARTMAQLALRTTERQGVPASPPVSPGGAAVVGGGDLQGCWTQRLEKVEDELNRWRGAARSAEALAKAAAVETAAAWDGYRREAEEQRAQWQAEQEAAVVALTRQLSDATRTVRAVVCAHEQACHFVQLSGHRASEGIVAPHHRYSALSAWHFQRRHSYL